VPQAPLRTRLAVDIGGTFTDVALESADGRRLTTKVLTTPSAPEQGVVEGIGKVLALADLEASAVDLILHGTTLATNALIERKGAKTALITTEGLRDSLEMAYENRFDQYDINIDRPLPLVPRHLRWPVRERSDFRGRVLLPLETDSVEALFPLIESEGIESLAIGLIHAYANPQHEQQVADQISRRFPELALTLSSEVCPEVREYERQSTACANAYVQPLMARYLRELEGQVTAMGFTCPFLLMTSGGGLTDLRTAAKFPIRLVESGPAGGAILASRIATECGLDQVLSYDMGGTTAKICLIDEGKPLTSRTFEVDRAYRFMKGSGLPLRIPVIEMVEIGAGGGSIASVDRLKRIAVGPQSAGADPGPACYGQGGTKPTVTDADVVLGKIDPQSFAGGAVTLQPDSAAQALEAEVGAALGLDGTTSAFGVCELVDENMANAARVHAIEWGKDVASRTMIAFGGAAPLHAARLAEKLGIERIVVPVGAGVGSAIGFLRAPIAYEVVRSRYQILSGFDAAAANDLLAEMAREANEIVRLGAPDEELVETRSAFMRYRGQGHEISVALPPRDLVSADRETLEAAFAEQYSTVYGRTIPGLEVEVLTWTLTVSTEPSVPEAAAKEGESVAAPAPTGQRQVFDPHTSTFLEAGLYRRADLSSGMEVQGPALIVEDQTTTVVPTQFSARINSLGYILLARQATAQEA